MKTAFTRIIDYLLLCVDLSTAQVPNRSVLRVPLFFARKIKAQVALLFCYVDPDRQRYHALHRWTGLKRINYLLWIHDILDASIPLMDFLGWKADEAERENVAESSTMATRRIRGLDM